jgi:hypothetical protein
MHGLGVVAALAARFGRAQSPHPTAEATKLTASTMIEASGPSVPASRAPAGGPNVLALRSVVSNRDPTTGIRSAGTKVLNRTP